MRQIEILDTMLRDGMQGEGISYSVEDKYKIALALDRLGIGCIEAGNPGSNPKDKELFRRLKQAPLEHSEICAFGATRRKETPVEEDANLLSILEVNTPCVTIFGKAYDLQVTQILETSLEENLRMIQETVSYLVSKGKRVIFDAEHFFDGYAANPGYAMETLCAARDGGADVLCLCDTRGGTYVVDIYRVTKQVTGAFPGNTIGIHCHNDCGLAVAGAMAAVEAGAAHVQGTLLGIGERCGNTNLSTLIPNLQLKQGYQCIPEDRMTLLTPLARKVAEISNVILPSSRPYVGYSAFAHKGGMHIDGMAKLEGAFEHIAPEKVGNSRRILMSEVAGKSMMLNRLRKIDPKIADNPKQVERIIARLKELEFKGYQFESAEESFQLEVRRLLGIQKEFFELEYFRIISEPAHMTECSASAVIKVKVGENSEVTAAEGEGPVNALDLALRKALTTFYPELEDVRLTDYKVRVLESDATTAAKVRVLIESTDSNRTWTTVGVSSDIIEASFLALTDAIEYKLTLSEMEKEGGN